MKTLTVLYDARCELCGRARAWLARQPKHVEMIYVAAGSDTAKALYPQLDHAKTLEDLVVIGDDGAFWMGAKAWIVALWALREYRAWALRLAGAGNFEQARRVIDSISRNRQRLSWLSGLLEA